MSEHEIPAAGGDRDSRIREEKHRAAMAEARGDTRTVKAAEKVIDKESEAAEKERAAEQRKAATGEAKLSHPQGRSAGQRSTTDKK